MIITCEKCDTRFNFNKSLIGESGSKVRCSICKDVFFVTAESKPLIADEFAQTGKTPGKEPGLPDETGGAGIADDDLDIFDDDVDVFGDDIDVFGDDQDSSDIDTDEISKILEEDAELFSQDDDKKSFDDLDVELDKVFASEELVASDSDDVSIDFIKEDDELKNADDQFTDAFDDLNIDLPEESHDDVVQIPADTERLGTSPDVMSIDSILMDDDSDSEELPVDMDDAGTMDISDIMQSGETTEENVEISSLMSNGVSAASDGEGFTDINSLLSGKEEVVDMRAILSSDSDSDAVEDIGDFLSDDVSDSATEPDAFDDTDDGEDLLDILTGEKADEPDIDSHKSEDIEDTSGISAQDLISEFEEYDKDAAVRADGLGDFDDLEITFDASDADDFDLETLASEGLEMTEGLEVTMDSEGLGDALADESNLDMDFSLEDIDDDDDDMDFEVDSSDDETIESEIDFNLDEDVEEEEPTMRLDDKPNLSNVEEIMEQDEFDFSNIEDIIDVDDADAKIPDEEEQDIGELDLDLEKLETDDSEVQAESDSLDDVEILDDEIDLDLDADVELEVENVEDLDLDEIESMFDSESEADEDEPEDMAAFSDTGITDEIDLEVDPEPEDIDISELSLEIEEIESDLTSEPVAKIQGTEFDIDDEISMDASDLDLDFVLGDDPDAGVEGDLNLDYDDTGNLTLDDGNVEMVSDLSGMESDDEEDDFSEIETMLEEEDDVLIEMGGESDDSDTSDDDLDFSDIESLLDDDTDASGSLSLDLEEDSGVSEYESELDEFNPEDSDDDQLNKTYELSLDDDDGVDLSESLELSLEESDFDDMQTELEESLSISLEGPDSDFLDADLDESLDITLNDLEEDSAGEFDPSDAKTVNLDNTDERSSTVEEVTVDAALDEDSEKKKSGKQKKKSFRKRKTSKLLVFLFIVIAIAAGGWYFLTQSGFALGEFEIPYMNKKVKELNMPPEVADFLGIKLERFVLVPLQNTIAGKYAAENTLFVITGEIRNDSNVPVSNVEVTGTLLSTTNKILKTKTVFCGNIIPQAELEKMNMRDINKRLKNRSGDKNSNVNVAPGRKIPFMIVIDNLPESLGNMKVEAVQIK